MTYELKGGEYIKDGKLHGWTGAKCPKCGGHGEEYPTDCSRPCPSCGGTGDEHALMPVQPKNLPTPNTARLEVKVWNADGVLVVNDLVAPAVALTDDEIKEAIKLIEHGCAAHTAVMLAKQHIPTE